MKPLLHVSPKRRFWLVKSREAMSDHERMALNAKAPRAGIRPPVSPRTAALLVALGVLVIGAAVIVGLRGGTAAAWIAFIGTLFLIRGIGDSITGPTPDETARRQYLFYFLTLVFACGVGVVGGILLLCGLFGPDDQTRYLVGGAMVVMGTLATAAVLRDLRPEPGDGKTTDA